MSRTKKSKPGGERRHGSRGGFRGNRGGRGDGGGGGRGRVDGRWGTSRSEIARQNAKFEGYYRGLSLIPDEEWEAFWNALKSALPSSFRFAGSRGHALTVQKRLIDYYIPEITSVEWEGAPVSPPTPVEWFPDKLAWSMTTPKNVIRRFPPFASFQKFLVSENNVGNITRQEVVSMIPPLLLDIKPGMTVLDLCAAPGSKSAQIIELLHGGEEARVRKVIERAAADQGRNVSPGGIEVEASRSQAAQEDDYTDDGRATGLLIANDVDYRRAQMLIHQCKRLNSPNLIVTNHDATLFPSIKMPSEFGPRYLKFDRILADVPCSGDGTCRKNPEIWKEWLPTKALGLHLTQLRILVRALQMLKVGGRVVYSTCSMNPIENEAVVAGAIHRCGGLRKVKLVDQSEALPGLKRRSGITDWKVMDKVGRWWDSWEDVAKSKEEQGEEGTSKLTESMFPSKDEEQIPLNRCVRIYPHLQDTGGFFIAVLEKQSEIKARPENDPKSAAVPAVPSGTSIMSIVNEIEAETDAQANNLEHVGSLDQMLPPKIDPQNDMNNGNAPAAARQNEENAPAQEVSARKRALDEEADALAANKRPKTRDSPDEAAEEGAEDRLVHWPPPPGADLELTAHRHDNQSTVSTTNAKLKSTQQHEEAFIYIPPNHPELEDIYAFYKLSPRFPRDRFMVRNATGEPVKAIYYTSTLARDILIENEGKGLKFVHCGVKMFVKQDVQNQANPCKWRIQSEGLPIIEAWIGEERVVRLQKREVLRRLLIEMFPKLAGTGQHELGEVGDRVRDLGMGCCVLRVEPRDAATIPSSRTESEEEGFDERLVMPLWRGASSVNLMLPKDERIAMLLRLFNDETPLVDHSNNKREREVVSEKPQDENDHVMDEPEPSVAAVVGNAEVSSDGSKPVIIDEDDDDVENDDEDDEDGGVRLDGAAMDVNRNIAAERAGAEERYAQAEDALLAEKQHAADTTKELAPGVFDEADVTNTTV